VAPLLTVELYLSERGGQRLLEDPLLPIATAEVIAAGRPRCDATLRRRPDPASAPALPLQAIQRPRPSLTHPNKKQK
jgi:hypothetical protein